jgi:cation transport ATPase
MFTLVRLIRRALWRCCSRICFRPRSRDMAIHFEAAAVIVVLVLLGQVFELRARQQTSSAMPGASPKKC